MFTATGKSMTLSERLMGEVSHKINARRIDFFITQREEKMETEASEPQQEIDDLASDQVLTEPVTQLPDVDCTVNELSLHNCEQMHVTLYRDRVVLRSRQPFTLRRFRQQLQVNLERPPYHIELNPGCDQPVLTRADVIGGAFRRPLKTYRNRHQDSEFMATTLAPLASPRNDEGLVRDAGERYLFWEIQGDLRRRAGRWDTGVELLPEHVAAQRQFQLGYREMHERRLRDLQALQERATPAYSEWTVIGAGLDLRFFNRRRCHDFSLENRTFYPVQTRGVGVPSLLIPYAKAVRFSDCCEKLCPVHCS